MTTLNYVGVQVCTYMSHKLFFLRDSCSFSLLFPEEVNLGRSGGDSQVKKDKHLCKDCEE